MRQHRQGKGEDLDVETCLRRMEDIERSGGVFAGLWMTISSWSRTKKRKYSFYADFPVNIPAMLENAPESFEITAGNLESVQRVRLWIIYILSDAVRSYLESERREILRKALK